VLRYALAPRWWFLHLVVAALFVGCLRLGLWQWEAARPPEPAGDVGWSLRNAFYAFEWWFFACVGLWFWGRFLRDQKASDDEYEAQWYAEQAAARAVDPADQR